MILSAGAIARVALLALLAAVLQVSGVGEIRVLGGNVDLVPLLVAGVALYAGSLPGAAAGFLVGLLLDLALGRILGASSLVLIAVGYGVGRFGELRDPAHGLIALPVGAAASAGYALGVAAVAYLLGVTPSPSFALVRELALSVVLNALLALPVFDLVRRVLGPALVTDPQRRARRRARREIARGTGPSGLRA